MPDDDGQTVWVDVPRHDVALTLEDILTPLTRTSDRLAAGDPARGTRRSSRSWPGSASSPRSCGRWRSRSAWSSRRSWHPDPGRSPRRRRPDGSAAAQPARAGVSGLWPAGTDSCGLTGPGAVPSPNGRPPSESRPCGVSHPDRSGPAGTIPVGLMSRCTW